jgi:hypothetical protein
VSASDESAAKPAHPHVAHYDEPDLPDDEGARHDAEALAQAERDSSRQADFARWRAVRYVVGVFLACVSIAGGAVALVAVIAALTSGAGPVDLVTGIEGSGVDHATLASGQLFLLAGALVALEVVLVWAATLLFSRGLHPGQWVAVGVMAASSTVVIALRAHSIFINASDWPYFVAFPLIVVASLFESLRIRGLRARWGG